MGEAKVVQLFGGSDDDRAAPLTEKRSGRRRPRTKVCRHSHAEVDADARKLFCRDCGEVMDPFDHLLKLARDRDSWGNAREAAAREVRLARARLEETLKEERNAKERVRRARQSEKKLAKRLRELEAEVGMVSPA